MNNLNWYEIENASAVDSPALLVYVDRVKANIEMLIGSINDVSRLRPHVKTHKTREATLLMMDAGIHKFKCATLAEADMLGSCQASDVLLAYPLTEPRLRKYFSIIKRYPLTSFSGIVDDQLVADHVSALAIQEGIVITIYLDINLGMDRTGIKPGEDAIALYRYCSALKGLNVQGFHAYDGHVREKDMNKRREVCRENFLPIAEMIEKLEAEKLPKPKVIIGGSPSFPVYATYTDVECSPGTFVFWDKGYADTLPEQSFLPAAVLFMRVISKPAKNLLCLDLGYKAVASESPLPERVSFLSNSGLIPVSQSEEHLVVEVQGEQSYQIGDVIYALPKHICPTVAMYDTLQIVDNHKVNGKWEVIARDRR